MRHILTDLDVRTCEHLGDFRVVEHVHPLDREQAEIAPDLLGHARVECSPVRITFNAREPFLREPDYRRVDEVLRQNVPKHVEHPLTVVRIHAVE
jgi:hypothetical protein